MGFMPIIRAKYYKLIDFSPINIKRQDVENYLVWLDWKHNITGISYKLEDTYSKGPRWTLYCSIKAENRIKQYFKDRIAGLVEMECRTGSDVIERAKDMLGDDKGFPGYSKKVLDNGSTEIIGKFGNTRRL